MPPILGIYMAWSRAHERSCPDPTDAWGEAVPTPLTLGCRNFQEYDPATDAWVKLPTMESARSGHGMCIVKGKVHVVGGYDGSRFFPKPPQPLNSKLWVHVVGWLGGWSGGWLVGWLVGWLINGKFV